MWNYDWNVVDTLSLKYVVAGTSISAAVALSLMARVLHRFKYNTMYGCLSVFLLTLEGFINIGVQFWEGASHMLMFAMIIIGLDAMVTITTCAILLTMGYLHRPVDGRRTTIFMIMIAAIFAYSLSLVPRILRYTMFEGDANYTLVYALHVAKPVLDLVTFALVFAYAFLPSLRVMLGLASARKPCNTICARDAADGTWYAAVTLPYLLGVVAFDAVFSPVASDEHLAFENMTRIAATSVMVLALGLPSPPFIAKILEKRCVTRTYTGSLEPDFIIVTRTG